jgi:hypothetical protein
VGCEGAAKVVSGMLGRPAVHRRNVQFSMIARMTSPVTIGGQKCQAYRVSVICAAL